MVPDLTELEIASGVVWGGDERVNLFDAPAPPQSTPSRALEAAVLPALERAPCLVSFSGGLDSSVVLAIADRTARRTGLPRPVPVTFRFTDAPDAEEDAAQEAVIGVLGIPDWQRVRVNDEAHMLGPFAVQALRRHGVLHPANVFLHLPLLERAGRGSLLTGGGGDQVLGGWRQPPRKRRPWWWPGRGPIGGRQAPAFEWLRPSAAWRVRRGIARERAGQPSPFDARLGWHASRRDLRLTLESLARLAAASGAQVISPLVDPGFVQALARFGGSSGFAPSGVAGRPALLAAVFPDLPHEVIRARRKATLRQVFWRRPTIEFLRDWDGTGVDGRYVDIDALRRIWREPDPPSLTALLAQQAWLHQDRANQGERNTT